MRSGIESLKLAVSMLNILSSLYVSFRYISYVLLYDLQSMIVMLLMPYCPSDVL